MVSQRKSRKAAPARSGTRGGRTSTRTTRSSSTRSPSGRQNSSSNRRTSTSNRRGEGQRRQIHLENAWASSQETGYGKDVETRFTRPVDRRLGAESRWERESSERYRGPERRLAPPPGRGSSAEARWEKAYEEEAARSRFYEPEDEEFSFGRAPTADNLGKQKRGMKQGARASGSRKHAVRAQSKRRRHSGM